jgi:hypothetical protein
MVLRPLAALESADIFADGGVYNFLCLVGLVLLLLWLLRIWHSAVILSELRLSVDQKHVVHVQGTHLLHSDPVMVQSEIEAAIRKIEARPAVPLFSHYCPLRIPRYSVRAPGSDAPCLEFKVHSRVPWNATVYLGVDEAAFRQKCADTHSQLVKSFAKMRPSHASLLNSPPSPSPSSSTSHVSVKKTSSKKSTKPSFAEWISSLLRPKPSSSGPSSSSSRRANRDVEMGPAYGELDDDTELMLMEEQQDDGPSEAEAASHDSAAASNMIGNEREVAAEESVDFSLDSQMYKRSVAVAQSKPGVYRIRVALEPASDYAADGQLSCVVVVNPYVMISVAGNIVKTYMRDVGGLFESTEIYGRPHFDKDETETESASADEPKEEAREEEEEEEQEEEEEEEEEDEEDYECVVCLTGPKQVLMFPCNHLCVCTECYPQLLKCPVCRTDVQGYVQMDRNRNYRRPSQSGLQRRRVNPVHEEVVS